MANGNEKTHLFTFMGTGAGCGVPAFFCECPACEEARHNPAARRGDCSVLVRGEKTLLVDTPPDTRHQLIREGVHEVDRLLVTHCHSDHISGMCEMEYMMQLRTKRQLKTYCSEETAAEIAIEFHYMDYVLDFNLLEPFQTMEYDGVRYTALPVTHAPGTFGYLMETDASRVFYASDTGQLPEATREAIRGVDVLAMDATYWKSCPTPNHHSVQECIEEGLALNAGKIYLTHLCMHYAEPITLVELEDYCKHNYGERVAPAADGLSFSF